MQKQAILILVAMCLGASLAEAVEVRIKDITQFSGERVNQLNGLGLVVGLNGTGGKGPYTRRMMMNMYQRFGLPADPLQRLTIFNDTQQKTGNLAVVVVTADLPVHARRGASLDVTVSATDAESIQGGTLMDTLLYGVDGCVYAVASGRIPLGGFSAAGNAGSVTNNHPTSARIPNGAKIEKEVPSRVAPNGSALLLLKHADFNTADRIAIAINNSFPGSARAIDPATIDVLVPPAYRLNKVGFLGKVGALKVEPDAVARVVINENTGTIVMGGNVRISVAAINHGNLTVTTAEGAGVSQPAPFSDGQTVVVPQTQLEVVEDRTPVVLLNESTTVAELATALNALAVSPRDLTAIFLMLEAAGALHARLEIK